jgi:hypothetical protein
MAFKGKPGPQCMGCGGFADTAFLIDDGYNFHLEPPPLSLLSV